MKPPFGIGQVGKAFRNEITPGNFIFRTREFEQMEIEFFVEPGTRRGVVRVLGRALLELVHRPRHRPRATCACFEHPKEKLSHYSKRTIDIEYRFGFPGSEWGELDGRREPHRLRPDDPLRGTRARTCRTSTRPKNER